MSLTLLGAGRASSLPRHLDAVAPDSRLEGLLPQQDFQLGAVAHLPQVCQERDQGNRSRNRFVCPKPTKGKTNIRIKAGEHCVGVLSMGC